MEPNETDVNTTQNLPRRRRPQNNRPGKDHRIPPIMRSEMPTSSFSGSAAFHNHQQNGEKVNIHHGQQQQFNNYNNNNNSKLPRRQRHWPRSQQQNRSYNYNNHQNYQQYQQNSLISSFGAQLNFNEHQQTNSFVNSADQPQQNYRQGRSNNYRNNRRNNFSKKQHPQDLTNKNEFQHEIMDELLRQAEYECIICCEVIQLHDKTWNCDNCFNVLHLKCVRSWATKCSNDKASQISGTNSNEYDGGQGTSNYNNSRRNDQLEEWRCPTCQDVKKQIPFAYYCFCGKRKNPDVSNYHVPHSCGNICGRELKLFNKLVDDDQASLSSSCPHSCTLKCHPGKCPTCQLKVMESCACGSTKIYVNCAIGASEIKCNKPCGKQLDCGNHICERNCHFGPCDRCTFTSDVTCKCGKLVRANIACKDQAIEFGCNETCEKILSCGFHKCNSPCHSGNCDPCPFDPSTVQHCPCGKTLLASMSNLKKRQICTDPIPNCFKICGKLQSCSNEKEPHRCKSICHSGPCPPCLLSTIMRCECGANTQKFDCKQLDGRKGWNCQKRCNKKLSCGRHKCLNLCCIDKQHICHNLCRRKLSCGQHLCDEPCHTSCGSCPNLIWEEVACNCGDKVLYPPLPCTTKKPLCDLPCPREHGCEHEPKHQCTSEYNQQQQQADQEQCPPCTEFVSKMCFGGHEMRHSTPCYQTQVSCGRFCMKTLAGCGHGCQKICHDGPCPPCTSKCDRPRVDCSHQGCGSTCHSDEVQCSKSKCREKLMVFCKCENKTEVKECYEVNNSRVKACLRDKLINKFRFNTDVLLDEIEQMVEFNTLHPLECDDQCAREKRSKELAEAFGCERSKLGLTKYSNFLKAEAKKNPQFIKNLQDKFAALIISFYKNDQKRASHSFPPMNKINREVIHHLSDYYGLTSQSFDREPNRNVIVTASKTSKLPEVTLLDSINIDGGNNSKTISIVKAMTSSSEQQQQNKKTIDYFNFNEEDD